MQNNQGIMQISENKDGSAKVLFRIRKAEMADVDEIMAVMHEAKNDKEHPDWFVSDDEEYVRTHKSNRNSNHRFTCLEINS